MKNKILSLLLILLSAYASFHLLNTKDISIDKVYVLNLDRSVQRLKNMQERLKAMELPVAYTRFSAVDGNKLEFTNRSTGEAFDGSEIIEKKLILKGDFAVKCSEHDIINVQLNQEAHYDRTAGEAGCSCSHRKIWLDLIKHNHKNALILEDDALFPEDFSSKLDRYTDNAPKDYDLLYLSHGNLGNAYESPSTNKLERLLQTIYGKYLQNLLWRKAFRNIGSTQGYIVSKEGAAKLLKCYDKNSSNLYDPIDMAMSRCIENKSINAYVSRPRIVLLNWDPDNISDIGRR